MTLHIVHRVPGSCCRRNVVNCPLERRWNSSIHSQQMVRLIGESRKAVVFFIEQKGGLVPLGLFTISARISVPVEPWCKRIVIINCAFNTSVGPRSPFRSVTVVSRSLPTNLTVVSRPLQMDFMDFIQVSYEHISLSGTIFLSILGAGFQRKDITYGLSQHQ